MTRPVAALDRSSGRLVTTGFGAPALSALVDVLRRVRRGDPLSPVDVVVPSDIAAVSVRRAVAAALGGVANVRFTTVPRLAARLAAPVLDRQGRPAMTRLPRGAMVRLSLLESTGPLARSVGHHRTARLVERVFAELDEASPDEAALERIAQASARGAEVIACYRRYQALASGFADAGDVARAAAAVVTDGVAPIAAVVLYALGRLSSAEWELVGALSQTGQLHAVIPVVANPHDGQDAGADVGGPEVGGAEVGGPGATDVAGRLAGLLPQGTRAAAEPVFGAQVELAPDAEEEVRLAVRRILERLADGVAPHRLALVAAQRVPYTRLAVEQLTAAGIPHHAASLTTLADSVTGRTLIGLLHLPVRGYAREAVVAWLRNGPIVDAAGVPVPAGRWERLAVAAGVTRGVDQWRQRLDRMDANTASRQGTDAADRAALRSFMNDVLAAHERLAGATSWTQAAGILADLLTRYLGDSDVRADWGRGADSTGRIQTERDAFDAVLAGLGGLADLDRIGYPPPTPATLRQMVESELARPAPCPTMLGRGVVVGTLDDLVGADFDTVIVLGMTESAVPSRLREDPLLRDADRAAGACGMRLLADRRRAERQSYLAALCAGRTTVLSCPLADLRAQRAQHPAPWLLETATVRCQRTVTATELVDPRRLPEAESAGWLTRHESFVAALHEATMPVSGHEYDVRMALGGAADALACADPRYERGRQASIARRDGRFGPWLGEIAPLPAALAEHLDRVWSATAVQTWASCPQRFMFTHVLRVQPPEDPVDEDHISALDRGSLVHRVLEAFFGSVIPGVKPPGQPWTSDDLARIRGLLDEHARALAAAGRAGRPLLWQVRLGRLRRQLARVLAVDSDLRARQRSWPIAVEDWFGRHGQPPVEILLGQAGTVSFAGCVDRVDVSEDGRLIVVDYKTGKGYGYEAIPTESDPDHGPDGGADLVDRGRKIQLVLYALAARARHGTPDTPVAAWYWFVEQDAPRRGAWITPADEQRLREVLEVSILGMRAGLFPARPGDLGWAGWENCLRCPYDRCCPSARDQRWEQLRHHPSVLAYTALAELDQPEPRDSTGSGTIPDRSRP
ncbi:MAG: PD-(D/E)XK nuclease family protein [Micromonosporaceae bacterium]|nr:PD-(D/E)XK nuclease family protein [Micromonosporaceae bacterium]